VAGKADDGGIVTTNKMTSSWLDRTISFLAPQYGLKRMRARVAHELVQRHYEAASSGRRTSGWDRSAGDANAVMGMGLVRLREVARDLVRNNPHAQSAVDTIANHMVGWGIVAKPTKANKRLEDLWKAWAETRACDSDGRNDLYGLQDLVARTVVESGEVLVRRRRRLPEDGLPLPLQLQVLDPDFLDTEKTGILRGATNGVEYGRVINGVEFNRLGQRVAYWLFPEHPGSLVGAGAYGASRRIPAEDVLHVYRSMRPGQVRAVSWLAPVILRLKDFDEFEDATLMKQKIAACLAVVTSDVTGASQALGTPDDSISPGIDSLEPGMILNAAPGRSVDVVTPPQTNDYDAYASVMLRTVATGVGLAYEDLTGDYTNLPFSAARMSRLHHWAKVEKWRWQMLIPLFCDPVWAWAMESAQILGVAGAEMPVAKWTAPPLPMIDPATEGLAIQRNIRTGITTLSESIRERGRDPKELLDEMAADNELLDELGIVLDSDARQRTQAGNPTATAASAGAAATSEPPPEGGAPAEPPPPPARTKKCN
jgi:lambda family phage portal protein